MINLSEWLDSRGTFKDVEFGEVKLQIVSLSDDLIEQMKTLSTASEMKDFVAEYGLAHKRTRISDDESRCDDLPIIWALPEFVEAKGQIVNAVLELSNDSKVLSDKIEAEEMAVLEAEESRTIDGDQPIDADITLGQLHDDAQAANPTY